MTPGRRDGGGMEGGGMVLWEPSGFFWPRWAPGGALRGGGKRERGGAMGRGGPPALGGGGGRPVGRGRGIILDGFYFL